MSPIITFCFCNLSTIKHKFKCFKVVQILKKVLLHKTTNCNYISQNKNKTFMYFYSSIQSKKKKTNLNMKPKTSRRLFLLLTFVLAGYNVLASISCLSGCQNDRLTKCNEQPATDCSDDEMCSRFQIESSNAGQGGPGW